MDTNAMQIGSFGEEGGAGVPNGDVGAYPESEHSTEEWSYHEEVNAIGNNGGYWQSTGKSGPWKGKGQGKGKGYSKGDGKKGKGSGKGPKTGCWICEGPHYASDCPKAKSKGKGKASPAYGLVEEEYDWDNWSQPVSWNPPSESIRQLPFLREAQRNRQYSEQVPHIRN